MRRILYSVALIGLFALAFGPAAAAAEPSAQVTVLLITGDDLGAHDWREISETTRQVLVESGKFEVRVCEDPRILDSKAALDDYEVIVFTRYNRKTPVISDQAKENLLGYVKSGKGFYVQHLASASFSDW
jgi:hypothetical protein